MPTISAPAAIVLDAWSGQVLFAKHADTERAPASTVKIMTALLVLEHHLPMRQFATVSALAVSYGGSSAGLYTGERLSIKNLLYGMLLPSGNDAAVVLAEQVAPTVDRFVALMNAEARRLRMWHTRFLTPNGFDTAGQVTTARDLAAVTRAAMHWRRFDRVVGTRTWTARSADGGVTHTWVNTNELLWRSHVIDGIKTGTTIAAGACLVASARKDGRWVIAVSLGSSPGQRFADGEALLNYGFELASSIPSAR